MFYQPINLRALGPSCRYLLSAKLYEHSEWALLLPAFSVILVLFTYITYFGLAIAGTPSFSDVRTITGEFCHFTAPIKYHSSLSRHDTDSRALLPGDDEPNPYVLHARENAIPELYDLPIGLVNRVVYGHKDTKQGETSEATGSSSPR